MNLEDLVVSQRGKVDFSFCKPIRGEFSWFTPGGHVFECKAREDGYISSEGMEIEGVQRGQDESIDKALSILLPGPVANTREEVEAEMLRTGSLFSSASYALSWEKANKYQECFKALLPEVEEEAKRGGKVDVKRLCKIVRLHMGSDYTALHHTPKELGKLGSLSLKTQNLLVWATPVLDLGTAHYGNHRSCWWGEQDAGEDGLRKCFNRCSFKAAGGFALLGVLFTPGQDPPAFGMNAKTDLRVLVAPWLDFMGFGDVDGDIPKDRVISLFNEYDKLSSEGWVTDQGVERTKWAAELLAQRLGYNYRHGSTRSLSPDSWLPHQYEVNSCFASILSSHPSPDGRMNPTGVPRCDCRQRYLEGRGQTEDLIYEEINQDRLNAELRLQRGERGLANPKPVEYWPRREMTPMAVRSGAHDDFLDEDDDHQEEDMP